MPQLHLGLPSATGEPPKRPVGFKKVWLDPGERTKVTLMIDPDATNRPLSYWESELGDWAVANGTYKVYSAPRPEISPQPVPSSSSGQGHEGG